MSTPIRLIVGLGNPGPDYETTRHNAGFWLADHLADDLRTSFALEKSFFGMVAKSRQGADNILLLKPNTYMNRSGQAVGALARFYKLTPEEVLVLHDELDLMPGQVKLKQGGGHAGHNGLRSIHGHLGDTYARVRLGIGHPGHKDAVAAYVLHDFAKADAEWLEDLLRGISDGAEALAAGDGQKFMNAVSLRTAPPRSSTTKEQPEKPAPAPKAEEDTRSPMQKLLDKFR